MRVDSENKRWLILELTKLGEQTKVSIIEESLKNIFGKSLEVFFPFKRGKDQRFESKARVLEGYIFVTGVEREQYSQLDKSPYASLINNKKRYVATSYIDKLRSQLTDICEEEYTVGELVKITDGPFSGLDSVVSHENKTSVVVKLAVKSRNLLVEVPKIFIERIS
jgi:transcription antitermination factor NusG